MRRNAVCTPGFGSQSRLSRGRSVKKGNSDRIISGICRCVMCRGLGRACALKKSINPSGKKKLLRGFKVMMFRVQVRKTPPERELQAGMRKFPHARLISGGST